MNAAALSPQPVAPALCPSSPRSALKVPRGLTPMLAPSPGPQGSHDHAGDARSPTWGPTYMHLQGPAQEPSAEGGQPCSGPPRADVRLLAGPSGPVLLRPPLPSPVIPETVATRKARPAQRGPAGTQAAPSGSPCDPGQVPALPCSLCSVPWALLEVYFEPQLPWFLRYPSPQPPQGEETSPKLLRAEVGGGTQIPDVVKKAAARLPHAAM